MARSRTVWRRSTSSSMYTASALALVAAMLSAAVARAQETSSPSGLGRAPTAAELRDTLVGPDGRGLPQGSGTAEQGVMVFARRGCVACHGPTGSEGPAVSLVGGQVTSRTNYWPISHWPFAPSIWDYIHRVMPYNQPGILTVDEVYAVTAYLLHRNGIIEEGDVMDAQSLAMVKMPHRADYKRPEPWTPETPRGFEIVPVR